MLQVATVVPPAAEYAFRLLLSARFGVEFAGIYDLAARAAVTLRSLAGALFAAMVPFAVHTLAAGPEQVTRLVQRTVRATALFILPASGFLLYHADVLMRLWLGRGPDVQAVASGFEVLLVAHALGALSVPAAMIGRAAGRPAAEAVTTGLSFGLALMILPWTPTFTVAFACFWGIPALGGVVLAGWLASRLGFRFESGRDLAVAGVLSAAGLASAAGIDRASRVLLGLPDVLAVILSTAAGLAVVAASAAALGVFDRAEWEAVRGVFRRSSQGAANGGPGPGPLRAG